MKYCSTVFVHHLEGSSNQLDRRIIICCGRLYRTVSYYPATVIVGIPPLILDVTARSIKKVKEKSWSIPEKVLLNDQIPINEKWQA
ncbi:hypothetical protein PGB90_006364 [Kerria lacca]